VIRAAEEASLRERAVPGGNTGLLARTEKVGVGERYGGGWWQGSDRPSGDGRHHR